MSYEGDKIDVWVEVDLDQSIETQFSESAVAKARERSRSRTQSSASEFDAFNKNAEYKRGSAGQQLILEAQRKRKQLTVSQGMTTADELSPLTGDLKTAVDSIMVPVSFPGGITVQVPIANVFPANSSKVIDAAADLTSLTFLEEANVLNALKARFERQSIYTSIAGVIVAINPCKRIPLYTPEMMEKYKVADSAAMANIDSHVYKAAEDAFRGVTAPFNKQIRSLPPNQSMVVCGESGSGKTESAKHIMRYLAQRSQSAHADGGVGGGKKIAIEQQIVETNFILEEIGNAATTRNHNSSRFGKFTKMFFDTDNLKENVSSPLGGKVVGASTETYLLEKSRVVMQNPGERNFHIFYGLVASCGNSSKISLGEFNAEHLGLKNLSVKDFSYINQGCPNFTGKEKDGDGLTEQERFEDMIRAMDSVGFPAEEQNKLIATVAGVLHLGNIELEEDSKEVAHVCAHSESHLGHAARLLGVDVEQLRLRILTMPIFVRGERIVKELRASQAKLSRDAISKFVFENLFLFVVHRINENLAKQHDQQLSCSDTTPWIGILDVFGFETFENNSFEQFCINFANERLQQHFNKSILLTEQLEYTREGIVWEPLDLPDGSDTLELIENRSTGVLALLDDACRVQSSTAESWVQGLFQAHKTHPKLVPIQNSMKSRAKHVQHGFLFRHFAEPVVYNAAEFIVKNKDRADPEIVVMFSSSLNSFALESFEHRTRLDGGSGSATERKGSRSTVQMTVSRQFSNQLRSLMATLGETQSYFIRCIKPNANFTPFVCDVPYTRPQLRCGGVVEAVKMLKCGYPTRIAYEDVYRQFRPLLSPDKDSDKIRLDDCTKRDFCRAVLDQFGLRSGFQLGLTKVFFRADQSTELSAVVNHTRMLSSTQLKGMLRYMARLKIQRSFRAVHAAQVWWVVVRRQRALLSFQQAVGAAAAMSRSIGRVLARQRESKGVLREKERLRKEEQERAKKEAEERAAELERLRNGLAETESVRSKLEQRVAELERLLRAAQEEVAEGVRRGQELSSQLAAEQAAKAELEGKLAALRREMSVLVEEQERLESARSALERDLELSKNEMGELGASGLEAQRKIAALQECVEEKETEVRRVRSELEGVQNSLARVESAQTESERSRKALEQKLEESKQHQSSVSGELSTTVGELESTTRERDALQRSLAAETEAKQELEQSVTLLKRKLEETETDLSKTRQEVQGTSSSLQALRGDQEATEEQLSKLKTQLAQFQQREQKHAQEYRKLEQTLAQTRLEAEGAARKGGKANARIEETLDELARVKREKESAVAELQSAQLRVQELEREGRKRLSLLSEAEDAQNALSSEREEAEAESVRLQGEMRVLESRAREQEEELEGLQRQLQRVLGEKRELETNMHNATSVQDAEAVSRLEEELAESSRITAQAREEWREAVSRAKSVQSALDASRRETAEWESRFGALNTRYENAVQQLEDVRAEQSAQLQAVADAKEAVRALEGGADSLTRRFKVLEQSLQAKAFEHSAALERVAELETLVEQERAEKREAVQRLTAQSESVTALQTSAGNAAEQLAQMERALKQGVAHGQRQDAAVSALKDERDSLLVQLGELERNLGKASKDAERWKNAFEEAVSSPTAGDSGAVDGERLESLEKELDQARHRIRELEQELEESNAARASAEDVCDELRREQSTLRVQLEASGASLEEQEEMCAVLEQRVHSGNGKVRQLTDQLHQSESNLQAAQLELESGHLRVRELESALRKAEDALVLHEQDSSSSSELVRQLQTQLQSLQRELFKAKRETSQAEEAKDSVLRSVEQSQSRVDTLQRQLQESKALVAEHNRKVQDVERALVRAQDQEHALREAREETGRLLALEQESKEIVLVKLGTVEEERERAQSECSVLRTRVVELEAERGLSGEQSQRLTRELDQARQRLDSFAQEKSQWSSEKHALEETVKGLSAQQQSVQAQLAQLQAEVERKTGMLKTLREESERKLGVAAGERLQQGQMLSAALEERDDAKRQLGAVSADRGAMAAQCKQLGEDLVTAQQQMETLRDEHDELQGQIMQLTGAVQDGEQRLQSAVAEQQLVSKELSVVRQEKQELLSKLNEARFENERTLREADALKEMVQQQQASASLNKDSLQELRRKLAAAKEDYEALRRELDRSGLDLEASQAEVLRLNAEREETAKKLAMLSELFAQ